MLIPGLGCGVRKGAPEWIPNDAAVIRCTVSGPNLQLPKLLDELPTPKIPTGLLARSMDPIALDQLGFERDRPVCASLVSPPASEIERASEAIAELEEVRREVGRKVRELGSCRCTYAAAIDASGLVSGCVTQATDPNCVAQSDKVRELATILEPLYDQLGRTEVPRIHWRLAGRNDRPGRFAVLHDRLISRHPGGSEVFLAKTPLPPRHGTKLIAKLLTLEGVVAVVRQDSGRALLIVRELDAQLILDHFAYPDWGTHVPAHIYALLPYLDDAQIPRYLEALTAPSDPRKTMLAPTKGYLIELDHAGLERVDQATLVAANFAQFQYDEARERRVLPTALVDRIAVQVPFGTEGTALHLRLRLTEDGRRWLDGVDGLELRDALSTLAQLEHEPSFQAARTGTEDLFLLRGRSIEQLLFAGPSALPQVLAAIEAASPGSLEGEADDFEVALPSGSLPGGFPSRPGSALIRERLSLYPHTLEGRRVDRGRVLALELERR